MYARPILCPNLIGRVEEMAIIEHAVLEARSGRGGSLVLVGEPGIGKSRLAREGAACAERQHMRVLWGRCVEGGETTPYRALAEALFAGLRHHAPPDLPELRPFKPLLGRLIPAWSSDVAIEQSVVLMGEGILRLLHILAGEDGGVIVLEDLHWADPETLAVVDYLATNIGKAPLLLLLTLRTGERTGGLSIATSFRSRRLGQVVELARLADEDVMTMARTCLGTDTVPEAVKAGLAGSAEGLPLLIEDLLAEWVADGQLTMADGDWQAAADLATVLPITFADTVQRRLAELGTASTELLRLAAILGRRFDWRILPHATGLEEDQVLDTLREAVQLQIISLAGSKACTEFSFRHALTRDAVLSELLPPQHARLAASLLAVVREAYPGLPNEWCELAARLAEEAGDREQAATLVLESGRRAISRGALTTAETTLQRAAALCDRQSGLAIEADEALIDALALAGKHEVVAQVGTRLLERLVRLNSPPERPARVHLQMARAYVAACDWTAASEHLETVRQQAAACNMPLLPSVDALAAHVAIGRGQLAEAADLARAACTGAKAAAEWEVACEALEVLGRVARERDLAEAEAVFEDALHLAEAHHLLVWQVRAVHELGTIDLFTPGAGTERLGQARDLAERCGALGLAAMVDVQLAAAHVALADFDAVLAFATRSADMAQALGLSVTRAIALLFVAEAHSRRGPNRPAMEAALSAALAASGDDQRLRAEVQGAAWGDSRAVASLIEEDRERALRETRTAEGFFRAMQSGAPSPSRGLWALLETIAGDDALDACQEVERSSAMIQPMNKAFTRYARAVIAGRRGDVAAANEAVVCGDALMHVSCPWGMHLGRRLIADEAVAHGWGTPALWLTEAATFFDERGQARIASACRSLLRKAGAPAVRPARLRAVPAVFRARGITNREMEILAIVGQGLSNRDIGARLYLSPKTVEKHISSLLGKLEVRTRAQLAAIAAADSDPT